MSDRSTEAHKSSIEFVLKRIGRVRKTADILQALK
jgi:isochorismate hydrolase